MLPRRLTLPPPHRLGHRPPSSRSLHDPPTTTSTATPRHAVVEETDSAPPASKRPRILRAPPRKEPIALTHDGKPLDRFSLYLPHVLPASITTDASALASYTLTTTATYLQLWNLENNMESVDLRLPEEYSSSLLHTESEFLPQFLETVFEGLKKAGVKSIKKLIVPTSSFNHLTSILKTLQKCPFAIKNILIPLSSDSILSSLSSTGVSDISKAAVAFTATTEITLVSSSPELSKILKKMKTACGKSNIRFSSLSSEETSSQGPEYLADLGKTEPQGEVVDPQSLIYSLNTTTSIISGGGSGGQTSSGGGGGGSRYRTSEPKQVLRRAFTTDCCYTEDPQISTDNTHTSKVWDLERLHERGINGTGTTIAVLDSGINYTSPAFKDKILAIKNFVGDSIDDFDCAVDSDGHGSLCAGIAAGSSFHCPINQGDPRSPCLKIPPGVAPGAKLIICKVVSTTSGDVDTEAFLAALKWLKELHTSGTKIDVVSISLASSYFSQERAQVICELVSSGVIVVCCASNVGRMKMQPISYPARLGHVLCIGAHDDNGKPTSFTPVGRELDFLAPGQDIWGPGPGTNGPFSTDCGSGTSCSTPAVAGLISLIIHDLRQRCMEEGVRVDVRIAGRPAADYVGSVWVMRELLKEMSSSPGHHSEEIGYGTLNPYRLLDCNTEEIVRIINDIVQDED